MKIFGMWEDLPEGVAWDVVPVPVGTTCKVCDQQIKEEEAGDLDPADDRPIHRECLVLKVLGHDSERCACKHYPGAVTVRECALELFQDLRNKRKGRRK